jgi:hypothetical protein
MLFMISVDVVSDQTDPVKLTVGIDGSRYEVTVTKRDLTRLARKEEDAASFVRRCFEFLLARESKESILSRFDVSVIGTYFPEFEREIR